MQVPWNSNRPTRRDGLFTRYWIADPALEGLCRVVCGSLAERHAAIRTHLAS